MRTFDLAVLVSGSGSLGISGTAKLAQRAVILLQTPKGQVPYRPEEGTFFLEEARSGGLQTEVDLLSAFAAAAALVASQLQQQEQDSDPADERLAELVIEEIVLGSGGQPPTLTLRIVSLAQTSTILKFQLPLPGV